MFILSAGPGHRSDRHILLASSKRHRFVHFLDHFIDVLRRIPIFSSVPPPRNAERVLIYTARERCIAPLVEKLVI